MIISLFRGASATGHVFFLKNGKTYDKGLAYSGFIGPKTIVAVVPTTPQILNFAVEARTQDKQTVTVTGSISVKLSPALAVTKLDFTVNKTGGYLNPWQQMLQELVLKEVIAPIHDKARTLGVELAASSHKGFEEAIQVKVGGNESQLPKNGILFESCSVTEVAPNDEEVTEAIGSKERQEMLAGKDAALHERRIKAAQNDRGVRAYEAQTAQTLEQERTKLLGIQGENKKQEATADAEATKIRLAPLAEAEPGKILGAALLKMAEGGRIGNLAIGPELLAALQQK